MIHSIEPHTSRALGGSILVYHTHTHTHTFPELFFLRKTYLLGGKKLKRREEKKGKE